MSFEAFDWNVVVAGAWNRAILTPEWIGRFLFEVGEDTPLSLEVPINVRGPWRVTHDGVSIEINPNGLVASVNPCKYETLDKARVFAKHAVTELSRTPLVAAGFNVRYRVTETPPELAEAFECGFDKSLSNRGIEIGARGIRRTLPWGAGVVNTELRMEPNKATIIEYNFHKGSSNHAELKSWLEIPIDGVEEMVKKLFGALPGGTP